MIRSALLVCGMVLVTVAAGCRSGSLTAGGAKGPETAGVGAIDFDNIWPKEEVAKLTDEQRERLLTLALVGLKGVNWQHAREVLIALGRPAVAPLIAMVGSKELSASAAGTLPASPVRTVGELAHDTLLMIIDGRTGYRGEMPPRDAEAWRRWWAANNSLKFGE